MPVTGSAREGCFRYSPCMPFYRADVRAPVIVRHCAKGRSDARQFDARHDGRCMAAGKRPTCPRSEIRTALFHACPSTGLRWHEKTGKNSRRSGIRAGSCLCRRKPGEPSRDLRCDPGLFSNASMLPLSHPRHKNSLADLTREFAFSSKPSDALTGAAMSRSCRSQGDHAFR